ncbi:MAG TPA: ABC-type transport auxiliary lipoprotein family protein [Pseudomonadales bacterium]
MNKALPLLLLFVLGACASTPPEQHEYLLAAPASSLPAAGSAPITLRPVILAPYLDQKGIVLQAADTEVQVARLNRWAEPLDAAVNRYLQVAVGNASGRLVEVAPLTTGTPGTELQVRVHQLHGSTEGQVRLVAEWSVRPAASAAQLHVFESTLRQGGDGYPALVNAHAALLDQLAGAIAASLVD